MAIPEEHSWRYIFHFTDIRNLDSIIKHGLLCTNLKNEQGIKHQNIANMTIQERRATMDVPVGPGGKVHDYVPFYFSSVNPMLLSKLNQKNVDQQFIIYLCVKIQRLEKEDAVFTDASANTVETPSFYNDVKDLDKLDWVAIDKKSWGVASDDERHKKMAEALIHKSVGIGEIDAILVFHDGIKNAVKKVFEENGVQPPAIIFDFDARVKNYHFYYTKFFIASQKGHSLVTGPVTLLTSYKNLLSSIEEKRKNPKTSYHYANVSKLVEAIDNDFTVLPELKAVEGLMQDYEPHKDTVDDHTKKVVEAMKHTSYYKNASDDLKSVLRLAAYLHDIGKGPKSKWNAGKMTGAYPDHPADAIPMAERILTEEIENLTVDETRRICMMVVYHDIIGDCMEKGREKQQVVDVIESEDDLDMLFAISCADAMAINGAWCMNIFGRKNSFKNTIMSLKQGRV